MEEKSFNVADVVVCNEKGPWNGELCKIEKFVPENHDTKEYCLIRKIKDNENHTELRMVETKSLLHKI